MNYNRLAVVTPQNQTIVSVAEIKRHLFISHDDEDKYLADLAKAVTAFIDGPDGIGVSIAEATYRLTLDCLPRQLQLPMHPVKAITEITIDGEALNDFILVTDRSPAMLHCTPQHATQSDGVKITFTAGFDTIPQDLKQAAMLIAGHLYRNREATSEHKLHDVPMAVETILTRHRAR